MDIKDMMNRIKMLEYHQKLLLKLVDNKNLEFYKLIVGKSIDEKEVRGFEKTCEILSMELEEQKAEGFVYFHPLYNKFKDSLPEEIEPREAIQACLKQGLYKPLMSEFVKYL
ncbi:DUF1878 family protein [Bacillus sp. S/N-304-OC-R1]|uniref:DUF1878 family protein n=1 Tax=Bacillus sp. S/N-304-OC-R1 TaxID=2758034 RepID=UPI001C8DA26B|nr:DUF1878 family protein [Bacillus sp. S/N-304-OC-R1]MBY0123078.1 DUF1878 family protein [Bacillus sp. S/N-304-OC-R1]